MASAGAAIWFAPSAEASSQVWEGCNQLALFVAAHVRSPVCRRCRPAYILRRCAGWPQVALRRAGQECPILQGVPRRPWMTGGRVRLGRACAERELFLNSFVPVLTRRGPRARNACVIRDAQSGKASWHACAALSASARSPRERERLDPISNFQIRSVPQAQLLSPHSHTKAVPLMGLIMHVSSCQVAKTTIIRVFLILIGIGARRPQGPKHLSKAPIIRAGRAARPQPPLPPSCSPTPSCLSALASVLFALSPAPHPLSRSLALALSAGTGCNVLSACGIIDTTNPTESHDRRWAPRDDAH